MSDPVLVSEPLRDNARPASQPLSPAQDHHDFSWRYPTALVAFAVAFLSLFWLGLVSLDRFGLLPPPQLTNNFCADLKLQHLRTHPSGSPTVLAVGSSVTWRSFDSDAVKRAGRSDAIPLNGAFCGLKMNQTAFTASYFLARFPAVRDVLTIVAPQDLTECSTTEARLFNPADVDDYIYRRKWLFPLYLAYFDPFTLAKNVLILRTLQNGGLPLEKMEMDRYGDAPLDTNIKRPDLVYSAFPPFDPTCFAALRDLALKLTATQQRLIVATTPLNPEWTELYDPNGTTMRQLADGIREALKGSTATFWDGYHAFPMASGQFIDAIHIRWSGAKSFSQELVGATGLGKPSVAFE